MIRKDMTSNNKKIVATPEVLAGLQQMSHDFHMGVYAQTTKVYGDQEQKYIDELLSFSYKMVQAIGIVAGFGFTALGFVKNIHPFVFGEVALIASMIYGIYNLKSIYTKIIKTLRDSSSKKIKVMKEKSDLFVRTILGAVEEKHVDMDIFESELSKVDKKLLSVFSGDEKEGGDEVWFLNILMMLFALGALLMLYSFLEWRGFGAVSSWFSSCG